MFSLAYARPNYLAVAVAAASLSLVACATESDPAADDVDDAAAAIELDDGGLDMADEAPMFGSSDLFDRADQAEVDTVYTDPLADDPAVAALRERPDAAIYRVRIQWGQFPADRDQEVARNWTGAIRISRGALLVRGVIRFEDATDRVLPREQPTEVQFTSATRPHNDGLVLMVIDPEPAADEPLLLTFTTLEGDRFEVPVRALLDGPLVEQVDDLGNQIAAVAILRPVDVCEHGFLAGRWGALRPGLGRLLGRVVDADGEPKGHLRGIYGKRESGEQVFFAKYIGRDGAFRGLLAGVYAEGAFRGRWLTRAGEHGVVAGEYREGDAAEHSGQFMGRWAERSCDLVLGDERGQ
jgi:hypothetical protein